MDRAVWLLGFIVSSRFFGLFLVLPVLSLYALNLKGANSDIIGLLVGGYAVAQMVFQIPFGMASDHFGRRPVLVAGLLVFIAGSVICAVSESFWVMFLGRLLQGSGAVGAVASAMISDLVPENKRSKAMAVVGMMMGASFTLAMLIAPVLSGKWGLGSLFWLSAGLTLACVILIFVFIKESSHPIKNTSSDSAKSAYPIGLKAALKDLKIAMKNRNIAIMNITNFMQKMLMSGAFVVIPIVLVKELGFERLWVVYAAGAVLGFLAMGFAGAMDGKKGISKALLIAGVGLFGVSWLGFGGGVLAESALAFGGAVGLFFVAFNLHEPVMQSCASRFALRHQRGAVLGVFNSFGYAGSFAGALAAGWGLGAFGMQILGLIAALGCAIWLAMLCFLQNPAIFKTIVIDDFSGDLGQSGDLGRLEALKSLNGVIEYYKMGDSLAIKYNSHLTTADEINAVLAR